ncbi:10327_t:CDS:2 [Entrophospora sp. SA101]|nr:10327_t:CDS:2 [Entrophospora sp. SA101]
MEKLATTPEQIEETNHVSFILPSKKSLEGLSRTPSLMSVSSDNFTLKQPHYHALYQPSWREKLAVELDNTAIGSIWKIVDAFLNILLCMIYIAHTGHMMKSLPLVNVCLEVIVSLLLIIEYVPKFYIYEFESWKSFFTSPIPLLTILTVFPCAATAHDPVFQETRYIVFFYPFRFIRCYLSVYDCLVRSEKSIIKIGQVTSRVLIFLTSIIFLVLTGSTLLHDNITFLDGNSLLMYNFSIGYLKNCINLITLLVIAVFFTTIMLGTVGYLSDIVPDNAFPRILLLVIFTTELPSLKHFLKEFYSLAHGLATVNTKVVILNPAQPNDRVKSFLSDPLYAHRVQYIRGSSLESRSLKKVNAKKASAYFILAKKFTQQSDTIDAENVLKAMALSKYDEGPKLYIQCILPENKIHFESLNPELILCIDELKLAILAHSCLTPGFSTLLYGLTTTFTYESTHELRNIKKESSSRLENDYIEDYIEGISQSIYTTTLSNYFAGSTFHAVVGRLYESLGVVLFAIGIPQQHFPIGSSNNTSHEEGDCDGDAKNYMVLINPGNYIVKGDEVGFIIACDGALAEGVSNYEWHNLHVLNNENISSEPQQIPSERQPLLSSDTLKNNNGGSYYDIKKKSGRPTSPDKTHHEYPYKPDTITRHQRALSTPLAFASDFDHKQHYKQHHHHTIDPSSSSSNALDSEHINLILDTINEHILLCDYSTATFPRNLDCFVSPLRKSHLDKFKPIVILSPTRPTTSQWKILSQFDQVYFVQGNPMTREGLELGRVRFAKQAVNGEKTEDAPAMLVYLNIKAMSIEEDIDVIVEFVHTNNMKFVSEDTSAVIDKNINAFMAGTCFSLSMLDSIICQSFYQPHLVAIINQLLFGAPPLQLSSGTTCSAPAHSHIFQIPVPVRFIGSQYGSMFHFLLGEKRAIPLGLYRTNKFITPNGKTKYSKYVYTCPRYNVMLRDDDKVFVLSKQIPSIL